MAGRGPTEPDRPNPDRYEPLPGIAGLPRWILGKMGRRARIAAGLVVVAAVVIGVALAGGIRESKQERAESERRERAELRAVRIRELQAAQRPRLGRSQSVAPTGAGPERQLVARAGLMEELSGAILTDSRRRVRMGALDGPIRRIDCEPFPRTVEGIGADEDLSRRRGRYSCLAVTGEFRRGQGSLGGLLGHQYRALVDFADGRYGFCKISGQAGPTRDQLVTTPRACGGR